MTALTQYERIEATGLWRPTPDAQRREVVLSIGEATLTISDFNDQAITHWSLAALERQNPGEYPAIFNPDGDVGETLELAASETMMIEAIERLQNAIARSRPHPGRLRWASVTGVVAAVAAVMVFWLPGALQRHVTSVVPDIKRQEIGRAILGRIERASGRACSSADANFAVAQLAQRTGVSKLVILPGGIADTVHLPGGIIAINKTLIEDHEDPAVAAGYILVERARAQSLDPLAELLETAGPIASFRLLTTGELTIDSIDHYAEQVLASPRVDLPDDQMLAVFGQAAIPSTPYAYARDITGESVLGLIEADPMAGRILEPVLPDSAWVRLQNICGT